MAGRPQEQSANEATPKLPQFPQVIIDDKFDRVLAVHPTGSTIEILLHGATIISWKSKGIERLWLSENAKLDGSGPVQGGLPLVFPMFGTATPDHPPTSKLPQHGIARIARWEYLGHSIIDDQFTFAAKLEFGLYSDSLPDSIRALWPYEFKLLYTVQLEHDRITTTLTLKNEDVVAFDYQMLFHNYISCDIHTMEITGLERGKYTDKTDGDKVKTEENFYVKISGETDRKYRTPRGEDDSISVNDRENTRLIFYRYDLDDIAVWNPWKEKAESMDDFMPKDGYQKFICVDVGAINGWKTLEAGTKVRGKQTMWLL
ncbi:hypothetical protein E4U59_001498 [Claviceps monticola]|nr:hypothetical protein E4U59_001498 [Claviceps monticola]